MQCLMDPRKENLRILSRGQNMVKSVFLMTTLAVSHTRNVTLKQTLPEHSSKTSALDPAKQVCFFFSFSPGCGAPPWLRTSSLLFLFHL